MILVPTSMVIIQNYDKFKKFIERLYRRILFELTWSKEEKKRSIELKNKYQLPKDIIAVKDVIVINNVKRTNR